MRIWQPIQRFTWELVEYRIALSLGVSAASGLVLESLYPLNSADPVLRLIAVHRPFIYRGLFWSYHLLLYSTPFLVSSILLALAYVHLYVPRLAANAGRLPEFPASDQRSELYLVIGEGHHPLKPQPSPAPHWLSIPERGLYTGVAVIGAIGSGKTQALILPAMRQLFAYRARDAERKLSGVVLEVKGDLCRQVQTILGSCGRGEDYVEVSLHGHVRYNPLNNDLDPYAQAYNIASIITAIWGRGKEPFWQQSYTDLVRYVILLHRLANDYVTLVDVFRTVISAHALEEMLIAVGRRFTAARFLGVSAEVYEHYRRTLEAFGFEYQKECDQYIAGWSEPLEAFLIRETSATISLYKRRNGAEAARSRFESVWYWYWEHWKFFRSEVKTSIIQGIAVFLSLFETDPEVRRVFCPPKSLYERAERGRDGNGGDGNGGSDGDDGAEVLPPFDELIESGKVVGLNFPVALNPALAKVIGTLMKIDYQRAVQLRIPRMEASPGRHFRPTVFFCDEYQNFATVGGDNPTGDERFLSISRQPKCIPIVATQSISSLKEALPNEGVKTLLQAFRTKIFLSTSDPDTARFASEICGKADHTRVSYTVSESSNNASVGWLSGRTSSSRGSVSASKQYQNHREPLFEERVFFELKNAQAVCAVFDGVTPLSATYCYLKPDFLPVDMTWFEQEKIGFDPGKLDPGEL